MNLLPLYITVGVLLLAAILVFLVYASLAVKHAIHFRYLSHRMLLLTLLFGTTSAVLIVLILISYGFFISA